MCQKGYYLGTCDFLSHGHYFLTKFHFDCYKLFAYVPILKRGSQLEFSAK